MINLHQHHNNCTTPSHMWLSPTHWILPSYDGVLWSCCVGIKALPRSHWQAKFSDEFQKFYSSVALLFPKWLNQEATSHTTLLITIFSTVQIRDKVRSTESGPLSRPSVPSWSFSSNQNYIGPLTLKFKSILLIYYQNISPK
jgi:hypothetical protein